MSTITTKLRQRAAIYRDMARNTFDRTLRLEFTDRAERYETVAWAVESEGAEVRGAYSRSAARGAAEGGAGAGTGGRFPPPGAAPAGGSSPALPAGASRRRRAAESGRSAPARA
jgi:hypothetical protein